MAKSKLHVVTLLLLLSIVCGFHGCESCDDCEVEHVSERTWIKYFPDYGEEIGDIECTSDGGAVFFAIPPESVRRSRVVRLDADGNTVWETDLQKYFSLNLSSISVDPEGRIYLTGAVGTGNNAVYAGILTSQGDPILEEVFEFGGFNDSGMDIVVHPDNGAIICGKFSEHFGVMHVDTSLQIVWLLDSFPPAYGTANGVCLKGDSALYVIGNGSGPIILELSEQGDSIQSRVLEQLGNAVDIAFEPGGSIFIAGMVGTDAALSALDISLAELWTTTHSSGMRLVPKEIKVDLAGNLTILGTKFSDSQTNNDIWIAQWNENGDLHWSRFYLSTADEYGLSLSVSGHGNLWLLGHLSIDHAVADLLILKLNNQGTQG